MALPRAAEYGLFVCQACELVSRPGHQENGMAFLISLQGVVLIENTILASVSS